MALDSLFSRTILPGSNPLTRSLSATGTCNDWEIPCGFHCQTLQWSISMFPLEVRRFSFSFCQFLFRPSVLDISCFLLLPFMLKVFPCLQEEYRTCVICPLHFSRQMNTLMSSPATYSPTPILPMAMFHICQAMSRGTRT
jgi:hypothetical protein